MRHVCLPEVDDDCTIPEGLIVTCHVLYTASRVSSLCFFLISLSLSRWDIAPPPYPRMAPAAFFCPFTKRVRHDDKTRFFLKRLGFVLRACSVNNHTNLQLPQLANAQKLIEQLQMDKLPAAERASSTNVGVSKPYRSLVHGTLARELNGVFSSVVAKNSNNDAPGQVPRLLSSPPVVREKHIDPTDVETFRIAVHGFVDRQLARHIGDIAPAATPDVAAPGRTAPVPSEFVSCLTDDQLAAFSLCRAGHNMYIGGNAGTGKSFLLDRIASWLETTHVQSRPCRVLRTAMTGIAAVNIKGLTLHHGLGIHVPPRGHWYTKDSFRDWGIFKELDVIFVDEVSMLDASLLAALDDVARSARVSSVPFGGIQLIFSGDFLQLAPVTKSILSLDLFLDRFTHVALTQPMRQRQDPTFLEALDQLRFGTITPAIRKSATINPPTADAVRLFPTRHAARVFNRAAMAQLTGESREFRSTVIHQEVSSGWSEAVAVHLFVKGLTRHRKAILEKYLRDALCRECGLDAGELAFHFDALPLNTTVVVLVRGRSWGKSLNAETSLAISVATERVLKDHHLAGCVATPTGSATLDSGGCGVHLSLRRQVREVMRQVERDPTLGHKQLKVGCRVMLVRNLTAELVNGSMGTVIEFADPKEKAHCIPKDMRVRASLPSAHSTSDDRVPLVQFDDAKAPVLIPFLVTQLPEQSLDGFMVCSLRSLPLLPAFAFTVHKVQGVTLKAPIVLDCSTMWPCPHLVYVAASRVQTFKHLRIINLAEHHVSVCPESLTFVKGINPAIQVARSLGVDLLTSSDDNNVSTCSITSLSVPNSCSPIA